MAKAILICGKIASGKTTYMKALLEKERAVWLSCDEIMLDLFAHQLGDQHDVIAARVERYLMQKSLEILSCGTSVVLDWGFWSREKREAIRAFYASAGYESEMHYVHVSDDTWHAQIERRNALVLAGQSQAYLVDEGLLRKLASLFEAPDRSEIDVWHVNDWNEKMLDSIDKN